MNTEFIWLAEDGISYSFKKNDKLLNSVQDREFWTGVGPSRFQEPGCFLVKEFECQ